MQTMEIAVEEMIVETIARSGEERLENSMDVEEKTAPGREYVTESKTEEISAETVKIPSAAGKNEERESAARAEGGTTSLALLAEAYDSSDSEGEEADKEGRKEEVRRGEEVNGETHKEENKEVQLCEAENKKVAHCEEEIEERRSGEEENKEDRLREEENENRHIGEEENKGSSLHEEENEERRSGEEENKERHNAEAETKEVTHSEEENVERRFPSEENAAKCCTENELQKMPEIEAAKTTQEEERSATEYRNETRLSSSSEDSESDSDVVIASSSAESDSGEEPIEISKKNEKNGRKVREKETKGEYDDLPPIEELKISVPEVLCDPLGEVGWMVEQMVVVKPKPGKPTLNLDTILFVERGRRVLGRIFDVFGQVSEPHYCVRFNSSDHIEKSEIRVGMVVYFCPNTEYTSVVFLNDLLKMKATEEIGEDEHPEFSDDEEERAYYAALRQKPRNEKAKAPEVPQKRQRTAKDGQEPGWRSNHPWSTGKKQQGRRGARTNASRTAGGEWPANQEHRNAQASPNFRQYSAAPPGANEQWPIGNAYADNRWRGHPNQATMTRPFFRPVHNYGQDPYAQNSRFPIPNFAWQTQSPAAPAFSWPFPPPPPPPPAI